MVSIITTELLHKKFNPTLEFWQSKEPFRSTKQTYARIENLVTPPADGELHLFIRGWLFDSKASIRELSLRIDESETAMVTAFSLARLDVAGAFPMFRQARTSGFVGTVPLPGSTVPATVSFFYKTTTNDNVSFSMPVGDVSLGVHHPEETPIKLACGPSNAWDASVALVILADAQPSQELLLAMATEAAVAEHKVALFSHEALSMGFSNSLDSDCRPTAQKCLLSEAPALLLKYCCELKLVVVIGGIDVSVLRRMIAPLMAMPDAPLVLWAARKGQTQCIPSFYRGAVEFWEDSDEALVRRFAELLER
jgi:hypothetical protein